MNLFEKYGISTEVLLEMSMQPEETASNHREPVDLFDSLKRGCRANFEESQEINKAVGISLSKPDISERK